jgi:hypothetical protein
MFPHPPFAIVSVKASLCDQIREVYLKLRLKLAFKYAIQLLLHASQNGTAM